MNYDQLQARANVLASYEGWTETNPPPDWLSLVNQAYIDFVWDAECLYAEETLTTVAGQAEYPTVVHNFKSFTDVYYDSTGAQRPMCPSSVRAIRACDDKWRFRAAGMPQWYILEVQSTLRLFPAPSTANVSILLRGPCEPAPLVNPTDVPIVPGTYHEGIANRAVYLHAYIYSTPERAAKYGGIYDLHVARYRKHLAPSRSRREERNSMVRYQDRVSLR